AFRLPLPGALPLSIRAIIASADIDSSLRSLHGLSLMNPRPWLLPAPEKKLEPLTNDAPSTPGISFSRACNSCITCTVRSSEAPTGNSTFVKMIPRSSLGTKPVGVVIEDQYIATRATRRAAGVIHLYRYRNRRLCT